MKLTCEKVFTNKNNNDWFQHIKQKSQELLSIDYNRLNFDLSDWVRTDINFNYSLCKTYPHLLYLPSEIFLLLLLLL